ncbi:MAG: thioredoxin family protein [Bacteroidia bacterium]|nr:thioredoxin family protein [Bacteroidia bacterium]
MIRQTLLLLMLFLAVGPLAPAQGFFTIDQAKAQSAATGKPILVVFSGSDWCKPCILLRKNVLDTETFHAFADTSVIMLHLDFPYRSKNQLPKAQQEHNDRLANQFNPTGKFPLLLLLDHRQKVLHELSYDGEDQPAPFIARLQPLLQPQP